MPTISTKDSAGFTLVEVMMAIIILTIGLFGLLQSVNVAYEHNARNRLRDEAVQLAEEQMNDFRRLAFDKITTNSRFTVPRQIGGGTRNFEITRSFMATGASKESKRLAVEVGWSFHNVTTQHVIYTIKKQ